MKSQKIKSIGSLILMIACIASFACGSTPSSGKVLVDINGESITEGDLEFLGQINPRIRSQLASPAGKQQLLDNLTEQALLYQAAIKAGTNHDTAVKAKIDLYRRVIIAQSLIEKEQTNAAKKYYDENPAEFNKLELSHIMIKFSAVKNQDKKQKAKTHTEAAALKLINELKARIEKGESFEEVAKAASEDNSSSSRGGSLGIAGKNERRLESRGFGPLLEKAFAMKVGEVSGAIKTSKGYHLITLNKGAEVEPFEAVAERISYKVRSKSRQDLLARLKKEATIVYPAKAKQQKAEKKAAKQAAKAKTEKAEANEHQHQDHKNHDHKAGDTH